MTFELFYIYIFIYVIQFFTFFLPMKTMQTKRLLFIRIFE